MEALNFTLVFVGEPRWWTKPAGLFFLAVSLGSVHGTARPNLTCFDLRQGVGIWTGIFAILHTPIGLTVQEE
jgi:fructose/tagatose bisphosphate aldolase